MTPSLSTRRPDGRPSPSSNRRVTIGFDYGTCSTKVQVRWRGESRSRVILVDDRPTPRYPSFATPSAVRVCGDRVFFGRRAVEGTGGAFYKSLKVQLLPPDHGFGQEAPAFPDGLRPELLIGCYLAWALGSVVEQLGVPAGNVALNVAAPMNHVENATLKGRYLQIIQAAWEAVFGMNPVTVDQGASLDDLRDLFDTWLGQDVPDLGTRRFEVLPETIAPLVSLSGDPRMEPGMYLMVDMGAGTTEFSINQVVQESDGFGNRKVNCYVDTSIRLGGDDFEGLPGRADQAQARAAMQNRFRGAFDETWYKGFMKDGTRAAKAKWRKLQVIQAGGGARHPDIQEFLKSALPNPGWTVAELSYHRSWHTPYGLDLDDLPQQPDPKDLPLLAVSHGLSVERKHWPVYFMPDEVETLAPPVGTWTPVTPTYPDDK